MTDKQALPLEELIQQLKAYPGLQITITAGATSPMLFSIWARHWLKTWVLGHVKDITYGSTYREPVELHLIPFFGDRHLDDITPSLVQEFFNQKAETHAQETLKKMKMCLKGIFDTAAENRMCTSSPISSTLRLSSRKEAIVKRSWTAEQYQAAYAFARHNDDSLALMILMETGMSRSELLGLTWTDFDQTQRCLHISNGLTECRSAQDGTWGLRHDGLKNSHRSRSVPITDELAYRLSAKPRTIKAKMGGLLHTTLTQYIIYSPQGSAYAPHNWYVRSFKVFMSRLHEAHPEVPKLTTHELRHTRATLLSYQGVDLYTIARLLGHRDLTMLSKRYLHDDLTAMRKTLGL